MHRLPAPLSEPVAGPGETLFETENARFSNEEVRPLSASGGRQFYPPQAAAESNDFLIPAQMVSPPVAAAAPGKRKGRGHSPNKAFMDDYFTEGEKKSRELDHAPGIKGNVVLPPPKAGESRGFREMVVAENECTADREH